MSENLSEEASFWKGMVKRHWLVTLILVVACVGVVIGGMIVVILYIPSSEIGLYGLWTFDDFSVGTFILWWLLLILWEFLLVILPFIAFCGVVGGLYWFVIMSEEDKEAIKSRDKNEKEHHHHTKEGGGIGFMFTIAFLIVVFIDGNWLTTFGTMPYSYYVIAWLRGFMWTMIIVGIPVGVISFIYFWRKIK
jgi:hypothetical protein